jgi:Prokaryotic E2 family E/Multiubiquitin
MGEKRVTTTSTAAEDAAQGHGKHFTIFIDKQKFETEQAVWTGAQLLALAGKNPQGFQIFLKKHGGELEEIKPVQTVHLREHEVERFVTLPLDQTEGADGGPPRRHFRLPERDEEFLDKLGLRWEAVRDGAGGRLIIHDYPAPRGYNVDRVRLNLRIEPAYPDTQIDMAYFLPHLARTDGRAIRALANDVFDGATWQRWSRHRTQANPWRPGIDDVSTHLALVDSWLRREFAKAA